MSNIAIQITALEDSNILDVITDAIELAKRVEHSVSFTYKGCAILLDKDSSVNEVYGYYIEYLSRKDKALWLF